MRVTSGDEDPHRGEDENRDDTRPQATPPEDGTAGAPQNRDQDNKGVGLYACDIARALRLLGR